VLRDRSGDAEIIRQNVSDRQPRLCRADHFRSAAARSRTTPVRNESCMHRWWKGHWFSFLCDV